MAARRRKSLDSNVIGDDGTPWRSGFLSGNEFSDHFRWKAGTISTLRIPNCASVPLALSCWWRAPEVSDRLGLHRAPARDDMDWFLPESGEQHMSHSVVNLDEYDHFKYEFFRLAGDVHV